MDKLDIKKIVEYSYRLEYDFNSTILKELSKPYKEYYEGTVSYIKFLSSLAILHNNLSYLEIGTELGASLVAFLYGNPKNKVSSLDVRSIDDTVKAFDGMKINNQEFAKNLVPKELYPKIDFNIGSSETFCFKQKYDIIFIDIVHNGENEKQTMLNLKSQNMFDECSLLIFDDIHVNEAMQKFWDSLDFKNKVDLSKDLNRANGFGICLLS